MAVLAVRLCVTERVADLIDATSIRPAVIGWHFRPIERSRLLTLHCVHFGQNAISSMEVTSRYHLKTQTRGFGVGVDLWTHSHRFHRDYTLHTLDSVHATYDDQ
jgi:hypothetical protein